MPLVRISVSNTVSADRRKQIADSIYDAMRATIGIPEGDRFIILTAHTQDELIADPHFPQMQRTGDFLIVQVTLRKGRSIEVKQSFYKKIAELLNERANVDPDNVMIVLTENNVEDWSFGRGEAQYVLNPPAPIPSA
jgi:phenylpyruvate tautomerase PptA (4-oxalocrotonate tautomerase family)